MRGSIQHRPNRPSPWRARYWAADGQQHSKSFRRKADADRWLRSQVVKLDRGEWTDPDRARISFGEWSEAWLAGLVDLKPKTRHGYTSLLHSLVLPEFGAVSLAQIDPASVRAWVSEMEGRGLSASRIRQARQVLGAALELAVTDGILSRNPARKIRVPSQRPREMLFLDAGQVDRLAQACEERQETAGTLVYVLAWTGLRWGEAVALRRPSFDLLRRRLSVRESATEVGGRLIFGTPKSHRARQVPLPRFLVDKIAVLLEGVDDELVFTAPKGGPLRNSNFARNVWRPACVTSGMPEGLRIHDLRHTAASLAISAGASIKAVQLLLGHSSAKITLDRYIHLFSDDLDALADSLDQRWREAGVTQVWPTPDSGVVSLEGR